MVVGGGPTGIAALHEARRQGIEAVGLEAGPGPTTSIREYLNGLVLISRPTDYEVAGIPLDTRDPNQLTREEVLHYLGRVINYGGLDLRFRAPVLELVPRDGLVLVRTPGRDWLARDVVVTAWYRRRRRPPSLVNPASGVEVIETLHDPVAVAGRRPLVVGGGMSAFEHATAVMMHGQSVTIVARHPLPGAFRTPHFETLLRDTGSRAVEGATDLTLRDGGLAYRGGDGAGFVPCDVLIPCLGHEVDPDILAMLS
ncbi:MAG TPA: NAD(P)-binding domain-containing protein, partial [Actinomycetota bacterium]